MATDTLRIPKGYKQTEIGVIPVDWVVKTCAELGSFYKGRGISSRDLVSDGLPCIMYGDIYVKFDTKFSNPDFRISSETATRSSIAKPGDLFFTGSGETAEEIGKCVVYLGKENIYIGGDIIALTPNPDIDSLFLAYVQNGKKLLSQKANLGQGYTIVHIHTEHIKSLKVPLPPTKKEQVAIATALFDTDALIEKIERLIEKKKSIKQGAMQELLTGKRRLPGFSGEWGIKRIGSIANIEKGRGLSKGKISTSGLHQCILYGELFTTYDEAILKVRSKTDCEEGVLSKYGDVLVPGSTTTTGIDLAKASALLVEKVLLGGDINIIRGLSDTYDSVFLAYCLTHVYKNEIAQKTKGVTIYHLHGKDLLDLEIQMPDKTEQAAIAVIITDADAEIQKLESQLTKYQNLKQGMMQVLLTGKIRLI